MAFKLALQAVFLAVLTAAATIDRRITGGEVAEASEFPFIVKVGPHCGGSLLDSTTVLTAAHCWNSIKEGRWVESPGKPDHRSPIATMIVHPDYYPFAPDSGADKEETLYQRYYDADIAVLKLSTPIEADKNITYAKLPSSGFEPKVNSIGIAAGWGQGSNGLLQKVELPILDNCAKARRRFATKNEVCAGGDGKGACRGDSGGPFIEKDTGVLIGVALSAICGWYTSFNKVATHLSFIEENMAPGSYNTTCDGLREIKGQWEMCMPPN